MGAVDLSIGHVVVRRCSSFHGSLLVCTIYGSVFTDFKVNLLMLIIP